MPRSIWSGAISFGLVNVPIKLYSAVSKKTVRFHQLHGETGTASSSAGSIPPPARRSRTSDIVKGYEIGKDRYVVITPDELESLDPEKTRTIDIEDFVDRVRDRPALLRPPLLPRARAGREKPYRLLLDAMAEAGQGGDRTRGHPQQGAARGASAPPARR